MPRKADGTTRSNSRQPGFTCTCGRNVTGNLAKASHGRACQGSWLTSREAYEQRDAAYRASLGHDKPRYQ